MHSIVEWHGKMKFTGTAGSGHSVTMDANASVGGEDSGIRPKELLLNGLAGCTAMDVISILRKMQAEPKSLRVEVDAELTDEHPIVITSFHMTYYVSGDVPEAKLKKAIDLSQNRYCGVSAMFRQFAEISFEYVYEE